MVDTVAWEQAWEAARYPSAYFDGVHLWGPDETKLHEIAQAVGLSLRHIRRVTTRDLLRLMHGRLGQDLITRSVV